MKRSHLAFLVVILSLTIDQILKIWIKTHMTLGEEYRVFGNWFILHFIENNGMAFGFELAGQWGKIILSLFRVAAIVAISYYLVTLVRKNVPWGLIISISLILAGASGNIIDSAFYGLIFSESTPYHMATLFPDGGGYNTFLHGKVVDMLYFPVIKGYIPHWSPIWREQYFIFFRPVFNIADSCITIGVFMILLFQKRYFRTAEGKEKETSQQDNDLSE
jgi:signal peptidase II